MKTSKQILTQTNMFTLSDEQLGHLKQVELMMLLDLRKVCDEEKIPYSLAFGTMLGAIRHNGFIPWDDDVDIWIPRRFFKALVKGLSNQFPGKYCFSGMGFDNWGDAFCGLKIMLCGTKAIEANVEAYPVERGIFIDVFPTYYVPGTDKKRQMIAKKLGKWYHMNALSVEYQYPPTNLLKNKNLSVSLYYKLRRLLGFISTFGKKRRMAHIDKITRGAESPSPKHEFYFTMSHGGCFVEVNFNDLIEAPFEGHRFRIFENYDSLLKTNYGAYMELPPENKREKHALSILDFGQY